MSTMSLAPRRMFVLAGYAAVIVVILIAAYVNDRTYYPIYAKCVELDVPIAMQLGIPGSPSGAKTVALPAYVDDVLFDFPELKLGCLHLGNPFELERIALARNYVNFFLVADCRVGDWPPELVSNLRSPTR